MFWSTNQTIYATYIYDPPTSSTGSWGLPNHDPRGSRAMIVTRCVSIQRLVPALTLRLLYRTLGTLVSRRSSHIINDNI